MAVSAALPLEVALTASHRSRLYLSRGPLYRLIMHQPTKFQQNDDSTDFQTGFREWFCRFEWTTLCQIYAVQDCL